jgi:hypothetical protein
MVIFGEHGIQVVVVGVNGWLPLMHIRVGIPDGWR